MQPDATPEQHGAHPRILAPRCAVCGLGVSLETYRCPEHPESRLILNAAYHYVTRSREPEPSYLTWGNVLVVLLGFATALALALLVLEP